MMKKFARAGTWLGARAELIEYRKGGPSGPRVVVMTWIDDATPDNGSFPAGTTTVRKITGDVRKSTFVIVTDVREVTLVEAADLDAMAASML